MLAPGDPTCPVQFIDARDLADFIIKTVQQKITGTMNAVGPRNVMTMGEYLSSCGAATESNANMIWVPADVLLAQKIRPWADLPMWVPDTPEMRGFARVSNQRAIDNGLTFRPVDQTIADTMRWFKDQRGDAPLKAGSHPRTRAGNPKCV